MLTPVGWTPLSHVRVSQNVTTYWNDLLDLGQGTLMLSDGRRRSLT